MNYGIASGVTGLMGGSKSTATTYSYGQTNYNAPKTTSAPVGGSVDYSANNPYYGKSTGATYTESGVASYSGGTASAFKPGTVNYGANYTPTSVDSRYGDFLTREYSTPGALAVNDKGQTAYDVQRGVVGQQFEDEYQRRVEDIKRSFAARGMSGSGAEQKALNDLMRSVEQGRGISYAQIGTEELQAQERRQERLGMQAFEAEQGVLDRDVTREMGYANLSLQEQSIYENARQFDNKLDFDAWATKQGYDDNAKNRVWQALQNDQNRALQGELAYADLNSKERGYMMEAWKFQNEQEFRTWAQTTDLDSREIDRIWQARENEANRQSQINQVIVSSLQRMQEMGYEDFLAQQKEERDQLVKYYHDAGAAGMTIDLTKLQKDNPTAYAAYMAGQAGQTLEDTLREQGYQDSYVDALIASFDPENPSYVSAINRIYSGLGVDTESIAGTPTGTPGDTSNPVYAASQDVSKVEYSTLVGGSKAGAANNATYKAVYDQAPVYNPTTYKNTSGADKMDFATLPDPNSYFKFGGKLYYVPGDPATTKSMDRHFGGINTVRFPVVEVDTGKQRSFQTTATGSVKAYIA